MTGPYAIRKIINKTFSGRFLLSRLSHYSFMGKIIDHLLFKEDDILVTGRYAFDAFVGSNLEQIIEDNDIETLFICGFTTDQCVAKTMRTAIKKGINSYLVSDCTATMNGFFQWKTERKYRSKVVNHLYRFP